MRLRWKIFWLVELILFVLLGYQIVTNPPALVGLVTGILAICLALHVRHGRTFWLTFGITLAAITIFINPPVWVMLFLAVVGAFHAFSGLSRFGPWSRKQFVSVTTQAPQDKGGRTTRHPWLGDEHIGAEVFEWDNINLAVAAGDTIIDLGNTFLPKGDNVIVIRKGFGKTRVLVPVGVGVMVSYSAGLGSLVIDGTKHKAHAETIEQFSPDYDTAVRRIHIMTNVIVGDVEVVPV